jgi:hypothetical protein
MAKSYSFAALRASGAVTAATSETLAIRCSGGQQTAAFFWKFEKCDAHKAPLQHAW